VGQVRILLSRMPSRLSANIVEEYAGHTSGVTVVAEVDDPERLGAVIAEQQVDALYFELDQGGIPARCRELIDDFPQLVLVGLADDGRCAAVFLHSPAPGQLI